MNIVQFPTSSAGTVRASADAPRDARRAQLEAVSEQFEALFLQQILKQMRKAGDVLGADSPLRSREADTMRDFYDGALAESLARQRQAGIAELLVRQLSGQVGAANAPAAGAAEQPVEAPQAPDSWWQRGVNGLATLWQRGAAGFKALVESVIRHESGGDVAAVSAKGARGLMQLMPDTAREVAGELGVEYSETRLTEDGEYNRRLGSAYLEKLLRRYDGHYALAVAAYNAGPARVDSWLQRHGDPRSGAIDTDSWVEKIPFDETRRYTRSILADLRRTQPGASEMRQSRVNSAADPVALPNGTTSAAGGHRSAAFAHPIRIAAKDIVS